MSTTATVTSPPSRPSLLPAPSNPSSYRSPNDPRSRPPRTIRRVRSKTDPNIEFSLSDIKRQDQNQSSSHPPASPVDGGGSGIGGGHNQRRASIENSALLSSATAFEAQAHALAQAQAQRTGPVHKSRYSVASIPLPFTHRQGRSSTSNDPSNPRIEPSQSQSHNQHDHYQHPQQHPQQQQQNSGGTRPSSLTKPLASSTASRVPGLRSWQRQSSGTVPVQAAGGAASASAGANPSASASASASASGS
ncbi:ATP-dependent RNA helicase dbp7, partial [Ascosphaera pollenicola]